MAENEITLLGKAVNIAYTTAPADWEYFKSLKRLKASGENVFIHGVIVLSELRDAHEALTADSKKKSDRQWPKKSFVTYCKDADLNIQTAYRYLQTYFPDYYEKCGLGKPHVARNTGESEWYTPKEYIEAALKVMGSIDVDPASCAKANETVQAKQFFDKTTDGRKQVWAGNVWLNPPYSQPLISEFCNLLVEKYTTKEVMQACVLVNNATETEHCQNLLKACQAVCFVKGRIKFIDKKGNPEGAPLQGQIIVYFGGNIQQFKENFTSFGVVLYV